MVPEWASLVAQLVRNLPAMQEPWVQSLGWENLLEKGTATPPQYSGLENSWTVPWGCKELDMTEQLSHLGKNSQIITEESQALFYMNV